MLRKLARKIFAKNTLYYPGCLIKSVATNIDSNYQEILKKLKIDFIVLEEFVCCGCPVLNAGYKEEYEKLKEKNLKLLDRYGISRIIVPCPACLKTLKKDYGLEKKGIKVVHITEALADKLEKIKDLFKKGKTPKITFHDPCHLGRHCGVYDEPRKLLIAAGFGLEEFDKKREHAVCCGGGGGVKANFPDIANKIAKERLKGCKTPFLVTACPLCYLHLKENAREKGIEVKEMSEVLKGAV